MCDDDDYLVKSVEFFYAIEDGDLTKVTQFIVEGIDIDRLDGGFEDGKTPLMCAAGLGQYDIVNELLNYSADVDVVSDGKTALFFAVKRGACDVTETLLEHGANIEASDNNGKTVLISAACSGYTHIIDVLLKFGADINATDNDGDTALMNAVAGITTSIKLHPINLQFVIGRTIATSALLDAGADINIKNNDGKTAKDLAKMPEVSDMLERAANRQH